MFWVGSVYICVVSVEDCHSPLTAYPRWLISVLLLVSPSAHHWIYLFCFRLCPSSAGSSPPPESNFFCLLLSLSIPLPVAPQSSLQRYSCLLTDVTPFICHYIYYLSFGRCVQPISILHLGYILDYVCHSGSLPNDGVTDSVF